MGNGKGKAHMWEARLKGGRLLVGASPTHLVEQMMMGSIVPAPDIRTYMVETSRRVRIWNGAEISVATPQAFLEDLADNGFIELWKDGEQA